MVQRSRSSADTFARIRPLVGRRIADVERDLIAATLAHCGGNRTWAADILGLSIVDLCERLRLFERDRQEIEISVDETGDGKEDAHLVALARFKPGRCLPS